MSGRGDKRARAIIQGLADAAAKREAEAFHLEQRTAGVAVMHNDVPDHAWDGLDDTMNRAGFLVNQWALDELRSAYRIALRKALTVGP